MHGGLLKTEKVGLWLLSAPGSSPVNALQEESD